jgi:hypothetical protein
MPMAVSSLGDMTSSPSERLMQPIRLLNVVFSGRATAASLNNLPPVRGLKRTKASNG